MASYEVSIDEITGTLGANNLNLLSGEIERATDRSCPCYREFKDVDRIKKMD